MLLKCASFNVNGLQKIQSGKVFLLSKTKNYSIVYLQKTHSCFNDEKLVQCEWGGKLPFSRGENNKKGVAVLVKHSIKFDFGNVNIDLTVDIVLPR